MEDYTLTNLLYFIVRIILIFGIYCRDFRSAAIMTAIVLVCFGLYERDLLFFVGTVIGSLCNALWWLACVNNKVVSIIFTIMVLFELYTIIKAQIEGRDALDFS